MAYPLAERPEWTAIASMPHGPACLLCMALHNLEGAEQLRFSQGAELMAG